MPWWCRVSTLTSLARAVAADRGVAQPVATVRHVYVGARPLVLVPLGLAGEASAPLAAMAGDDPRSGRLLVVPQPRNRGQRFAFAAELGEIILGYVGGFGPAVETAPAGRDGAERTRAADAPQLLVPNPAGVSFVRLLGRSTRFRRSEGEYAVDPSVPVVGRWLTFLAERAEHPGSCLLLAMTDALALHWASGQSAVEDLNLAALLGWIDPPAGMTGAAAAAAAEDPLTWPPAGPATDPTFDNEVLAPLIAAYDRAARDGAAHDSAAGHGRGLDRAEAALSDALAGQLQPTWQLMWQGVELLRRLAPGHRVAARWDSDKDAFTAYAGYLAEGGPPQPRRDSAVAAARRLNWLERAQASYGAQRAFDDPLVMAEHRLTGEAFFGEVIAANPARLDACGPRRKLRPHITVATEDPVRLDPGVMLHAPDRPGQQARLVSASPASGRAATAMVLELSGGMGRALTPAPGSVPAIGDLVCYTTLTDSYQPPGSFPAREDTPWTHGGPPAEPAPSDEEATEEWS